MIRKITFLGLIAAVSINGYAAVLASAHSSSEAASAASAAAISEPALLNKITRLPLDQSVADTSTYIESFLKGAKVDKPASPDSIKSDSKESPSAALKKRKPLATPDTLKIQHVDPAAAVAYYPQLMAVIYTGAQKQAILTLNGKSLSVNDGETTICGKVTILTPTSVKVGAQVLSLN